MTSPVQKPVVDAVPVDAGRLLDVLIRDLDLPDDIGYLRHLVHFDGGYPFLPLPHKSQAASAALLALFSLASARLLQIRGSQPPHISINTDHATLFMASSSLVRLNGRPMSSAEFSSLVPNINEEPHTFLGRETTNMYRTKDGRYFYMHGSFAPSLVLKILGIDPDQPVVDIRHAKELIGAQCSLYTADALRLLFPSLDFVGDIVLRPDEFDRSAQGRLLNALPLARFIPIPSRNTATAAPYPPLASPSSKPLEGIRVLELTRAITGGVAGRLLAEMGATVTRVIAPHLPDFSALQPDCNIDKRPVHIDLRTPLGRRQMRHLLETADIFLQGYQPGSMDKLGLSHAQLAAIGDARGKPFVIIDEQCYGGVLERGEWGRRPGYAQIADSVTGIAWETGSACGQNTPLIPCLPVTQYCTAILCAAFAVLGLVRRALVPGTVAVPVAMCSFDLWLRQQKKYPEDWVRATYNAGPRFDYRTGLTDMLSQTLHHQFSIDPSYSQPHFYNTILRTGFDGKAIVRGVPRAVTDILGASLTHVAPVIRLHGIETRSKCSVPWGYFRPGWDEDDADALDRKLGIRRYRAR